MEAKYIYDIIIRALPNTQYNYSEVVLKSKTKKHRVAMVRHIFMVVMLRNSDDTLDAVAGLLGRDHTTALYARDAHEDRLKYDKQYHQAYAEIISAIGPDLYELKNTLPDRRRFAGLNTIADNLPDGFTDERIVGHHISDALAREWAASPDNIVGSKEESLSMALMSLLVLMRRKGMDIENCVYQTFVSTNQ